MKQKLQSTVYEFFVKCRSFLDNEKYVISIFRGKSKSDKFAEKILGEIENVMDREKFCYLNGTTVIPTEYIVFISEHDNYAWYGIKRDLLQQKLEKHVERHLQMLSLPIFGRQAVYIQSTHELDEGDVRVVHRWGEREAPVEIRFVDRPHFAEKKCGWETDFEYSDGEYETAVKPGLKKLYYLEVCRGDIEKYTLPIFQREITLGRGANVDVQLRDDPEISRRHLVLKRDPEGWYSIFVTGQNPVLVHESMVCLGQSTQCSVGETITVGSYSLRMKD